MPSSDSRPNLYELYEMVLALKAEDRTQFLNQHCNNDSELREQLESLLAFDEVPTSNILRPLFTMPGPTSMIGERVGSYKIVQEIGEGGMGKVFLGEHEALESKDAIKISRLGRLSTPAQLQRFYAERKVLAHLNHPNIAHIREAGVTEEGLPYFAMEYVEGKPIDAYADEHRLEINERLSLFIDACSAVQHAHNNFIVHRDIKPSNIYVNKAGQVKLLDFGIAEVLEEKETGPAKTGAGDHEVFLTPEYASPEQVQGAPVSSASDVYSLGVVLYELLAGRRPVWLKSGDPATKHGDTIERPSVVITKPTTRRLRDGGTQTISPDELARQRRVGTQELKKKLSGDLDAIVMKALQQEPSQRYRSPDGLIDDIQKYLDGYPVSAHSDEPSYRVKKFIHRNRVGVAAAALAVLALLIGSALALWQARVASNERDIALLEATKADRVSSFLIELFDQSDPALAQGDSLLVQDFLKRGTEKINDELMDQPAIRSELLHVLGRIHQSMGDFDQVVSLLEEDKRIQEEEIQRDDERYFSSLDMLGFAKFKLGQSEEAEEILVNAIDLAASPGSEQQRERGKLLETYSNLLMESGEYELADSLIRESIMISEQQDGRVNKDLAARLSTHANILFQRTQLEEAESAIRESIGIKRQLFGDDHSGLPTSYFTLGNVLTSLGQFMAADTAYQKSQELQVRIYGDDHPDLASIYTAMGNLHTLMNQYDKAEAYQLKSLSMTEKHLGKNNSTYIITLFNLGGLKTYQGDFVDSEAYIKDAITLAKDTYGDNYFGIPKMNTQLATLLRFQGKYDEAEAALREAISLQEQSAGTENHDYVLYVIRLANVLREKGQLDEAEDLYKQMIPVQEQYMGAGNPRLHEAPMHYGLLLQAKGELEEATRHFREAFNVVNGKLPAGHLVFVQTKDNLVNALMQMEDYEAAEVVLLDAHEQLRASGEESEEAQNVIHQLVALYEASGDPSEATTYRDQLK